LSLKIFLTALAIVDDLGAVMVIAFFYSSKIILSNVAIGALFLAVMLIMNLMGVRNKLAYAVPGIMGIWLAFLLSGVHATIAGVIAAFAIPASTKIDRFEFKEKIIHLVNKISGSVKSSKPFLTKEEQETVTKIKSTCELYEPPVQSLEYSLHPWVIFLIMPIFALSNTGVRLGDSFLPAISSYEGIGIIIGLFIGKPLGIFLFSWLAHKLKITSLPENLKWIHILGVGLLGGIGFTMALFVASLAFQDLEMINNAKISILVASFLAGLAGYLILRKSLK